MCSQTKVCGAVLFHGAHFKDHYPVDSVFFVAGSGERAQSYLKQDRGLSSLHGRNTTTPNYSLNHARSGSDR